MNNQGNNEGNMEEKGAKTSHSAVDNGEEEKVSHTSQNNIYQLNIDEEDIRCDKRKDETMGAKDKDETRAPG